MADAVRAAARTTVPRVLQEFAEHPGLFLPVDIAAELKALGLREHGGDGTLHALVLVDEPGAAAAEVSTREIATISDHVAAAEVRWEAFDLPRREREHERGFLVAQYEEYLRRRDGSTISFVATLDGKVAGAATALLSDRGLFLVGAATAPWARKRGVYRALVGARWRYALDRGTPALAVHAVQGTSCSILRRLGFREVCTVRARSAPAGS